jgi:hypothetical protein
MLPGTLIPALLLMATLPATAASAAQEEAYAALVGLGFELNEDFTLAAFTDYEPPRQPGERYLTRDEFFNEVNSGNTHLGGEVYIVDEPASGTDTVEQANVAHDLAWRMGGEWLPADFFELESAAMYAREPVYLSDDFVVIDFERIENPGDYVNLLTSMCRLGDGVVAVANARDHLPPFWLWQFGLGSASLDFDFNGAAVHWPLEVEDDWVDPLFFVRFDALIEQTGSGEALYSFNDGQYDLFFITDSQTASELAELVEQPVRDWRSFRGVIQ